MMTGVPAKAPESPLGEQLIYCSMCGHRGLSRDNGKSSPRGNFACAQCNATTRYRDQAAILVDVFSDGTATCLTQLVSGGHLEGVTILEWALRSPFARRLRGLPGYTQANYWEDVPAGATRDGIRSENLGQLSFPDETFDLVITSDVFSHVFEHEAAFAEIYRVLRRGGVHVCSIPVQYPMPLETKVRAELRDGEIYYYEEPRYHLSGDEAPTLVTIEYGADLLTRLKEMGYAASYVRRSLPHPDQMRNVTLVSRKLGR